MNVWTLDPKNAKPKNRQLTPFDEQPSSSRLNILGFPNERESEFSQGKFTQNHSASSMNVSHMLSNLQLNEPSNIHQQATVERRLPPSSQPAHSSSIINNHHQNSHGNYVDIDAIDSILLENENNFLHFSTNNVNAPPSFDRSPTENHIQKLIDSSINSPIYENPSYLRAESPIYSNTHNQTSIASLYSKSQNIYSNLPAISSTAGNGAYAHLTQSHQVLAPSKLLLVLLLEQLNNQNFLCSSPTAIT